MTPSEHIIHSTVRIIARSMGGTSIGTGFFFSFNSSEDRSIIPTIVTNKHVIKGALTGQIIFSLCDDNGNYIQGKRHEYNFYNFEKAWISHPDSDVDLCIMPIHQLYKEYKPNPYNLYLTYLSENDIPSQDEIEEFSHIEDIIIVGYPDGVWDGKNNLPLVRRGITASSLHYDFDGKPQFIMDAAIFGGSSGSPVLLYNEGQYIAKNGIMFGTRIKLVGINRAVFLHPITGEVTKLDQQNTALGKTLHQMPNNLGIAIHARKLLDFKPLLQI